MSAAEVIAMPPKEPRDVDDEILRFLREERAANDRRGKSLAEKLEKTLETLSNQFDLHDQKDDRRQEEVMQRFTGVEARLTALEKDNEVTGRFVLDKKAVEAVRTARLRRIGWKVVEYVVLLVVGAVFAHLFLGGHLVVTP